MTLLFLRRGVMRALNLLLLATLLMGHLLTCVMRKNKCVAGVIVALNRRALNVGSGINLLGEAIYNGLSYRIFGALIISLN
jgi:hypothetical protein